MAELTFVVSAYVFTQMLGLMTKDDISMPLRACALLTWLLSGYTLVSLVLRLIPR